MSYVRRVALLAAACLAGGVLAVAPATAATAAAPAPQAAPPQAAPQAAPTPAAPQAPPEFTGTYQRVAKDIVQADGSLRDVYSDWLVTDRKSYRLRLPKGVRLAGGTPVRVRGRLSGQDLQAEQVQQTAPPSKVATTGTTKVLVVLVYWTAPDEMTVTKARNQVFADDHGWFGEASYGRLGLTGDATGWHKILAPTGGHCFAGHKEIMDRAKAKAKAAGYDSVNYDRTTVYFPACGGDAAGAAGWAYEPGNTVWLNGYFDRRVSVHEQGHNYGLPHAHTYNCSSGGTTVTLGGTCNRMEYGDDFDAMGGSPYAAHFSGPQKDKVGWLGTRKKALTSATTTFTLAPFEKTPATTAPLAAVIQSSLPSRKYWMEYRQPVGYDNALPPGATTGVLVRMTDTAILNEYSEPAGPMLLDMSPQNAFDHAVIPSGGAWTSPEGVRISVGAVSANGASVTVQGGANPPTAPSAPRNVVATGGDGSVRLAWDAPLSNGGATVQSYVVTGTPGAIARVVDGTAVTIDELTNGTEYTFLVAAKNVAGTSVTADPAKAIPTAQLPTVAVTAPAAFATIGGTVTLRADAAPHPLSDATISSVTWEVDGEQVAYDDTAPYEQPWDSSWTPDGVHEITATAYDTKWRFRTSEPVEVEIVTPRPTISILTPENGRTITTDLVELTASSAPVAEGGAALQWVTYELADGTVIGYADATEPHAALWDTTALNGAYEIVARVYDEFGRSGVSAPVEVTIQHPVPSVTLTSPAEGATVKDTVTVTADPVPNAETQRPIDQVVFYADSEQIGSAYQAPFSIDWDSSATSGEVVLTAVAYDADRRTATSPGRTVLVDNPLPSVSLTSPTSGQVVEGAVTITAAAAAHPDGGTTIDRVEFLLDGFEPIGTVPGPGPYTVTWNSGTRFGPHSLVARAYDTAGRTAATKPLTFTVKYPTPTATIAKPVDGAVLGTGTHVIEATGAVDPRTPDRQLDHAEFYVNGEWVGDDWTPADGFTTTWRFQPGEHYVHAVLYDSQWTSATSPAVDVTVVDPPNAPTAVVAVAGGDGTATLTWTAPTGTSGLDVLGYAVVGSDGKERAATGSPFTVTELANGTSYTFRVKARTAVGYGTLSEPTNAVVPGTRTALAVAVSPSTVSYGKAVTVTGKLTRTDTAEALGGRTVQLLVCTPGTATCSVAKSVVTGPDGGVSTTYTPRLHRDLRLRYLATGDRFLEATSAAKRVRVRAVLTSRVSATTIRLGGTVTVSGAVKPAHATKLVYLQRYSASGWTSIAKKAQSATGAVSFSGVKPAAKGTFRYRLYFPGDTDHLAGYSPALSVKVT